MNGSRMPAVECRVGCSFTSSMGFSSGFAAAGAGSAVAGLAAATFLVFLSAGLTLIACCTALPFFADASAPVAAPGVTAPGLGFAGIAAGFTATANGGFGGAAPGFIVPADGFAAIAAAPGFTTDGTEVAELAAPVTPGLMPALGFAATVLAAAFVAEFTGCF